MELEKLIKLKLSLKTSTIFTAQQCYVVLYLSRKGGKTIVQIR